ncbi:unnamed protein product [Lepeophtheirus salmonis]|uniref:(salmon louse) hypothetical protein n=1 Tax=Lepeophtheirus salmonis TaxID=72036 RepID=A0A7R8H7I6_LEPSM|nr:unnamed protein product [Lepeophtheirus salmonis]CAF2919205.1 unnamed protein product [Lepeophtheirus salmonis]
MSFGHDEGVFKSGKLPLRRLKFDYVAGTLNQEVAPGVQNLIIYLLTIITLKALKITLMDHLSASKQQRLQQLLVREELGPKKPSQLLHRMRQLEVGALVDKVTEVSTPSISTVSISPATEIQRLEQKITGLEQVIHSLTMKELNRRSRSE